MRLIILLVVLVAAVMYQGTSYGAVVQPSIWADNVAVRNRIIARAMAKHNMDTLVGDYLRIVPVEIQSKEQLSIVSLQNCSAEHLKNISLDTPNSFEQHGFAYLVSSDLSHTNLRGCTRAAIIEKFGQPNTTTLIAGTADKPTEQLLFYESGVHEKLEKDTSLFSEEFKASSADSLQPVMPNKIANRSCPGHRTILQIVAHEDDDLLFMNPDLLHSIKQGDCVRTVYITAGDAGSSKFYWLGRERGSEAAYSLLSGVQDNWVGQTVKLDNQQFISAVSPGASGQLSLLFMHLPDGSPDGQGFANSQHESIAKLVSGEIPAITSVDNQSTYSSDNLTKALEKIMDMYQPDEIRTQRPYNDSVDFSDHSDHLTVGTLASAAFASYTQRHPAATLDYYTGYPIYELPENVVNEDLQLKEQAFFTYAQYDGAVCGSMDACMASGNYGAYLQRQYRTQP